AKQQISGFSEGHARALRVFNDDAELQIRLVDKIKAENLSVEQLDRLIEAMKKAPERKEAFLRIPLDATEEIMKRSAQKLERRKGFKARTAVEYLKSMQRAADDLTALLDEEVKRYLSTEEMNSLLSTCNNALEELEKFSRNIRKNLVEENYGFMETYV